MVPYPTTVTCIIFGPVVRSSVSDPQSPLFRRAAAGTIRRTAAKRMINVSPN